MLSCPSLLEDLDMFGWGGGGGGGGASPPAHVGSAGGVGATEMTGAALTAAGGIHGGGGPGGGQGGAGGGGGARDIGGGCGAGGAEEVLWCPGGVGGTAPPQGDEALPLFETEMSQTTYYYYLHYLNTNNLKLIISNFINIYMLSLFCWPLFSITRLH